MTPEGQTLIVRPQAKERAVARAAMRLTLRRTGEVLSRFEAIATYRRTIASERSRPGLCVDRIC